MQTEEAVSLETKKASDGKWLVLLAAFLGWMFDGLEMGIFPLVASPALRDFLGPDADIGIWKGRIDACFLIGAASGGLMFGWLGDRIGRVRAMSFSVLTYSLFSGLGYFAQEPWHLAALRFIAALGMGGEWSLGVALVMECWPEKHRPILAGLIGAASNVGFALIAVLGMVSPIQPDSWRWVMLAGAFPALLTFFIRLFVPESEKWKESTKKAQAQPIREILSPALLPRALLGISFASIALIGTWGAVQSIPAWVKELTKDPFQSALTQFVSSIGAVIGCIVAPLVGNIIGRRLTYFCLCLVSLGATALLFRGQTQYGPVFIACIGLVGMTTAAFYGWLPLYLPELFPTRVRATAQGLSFNSGRIVAAFGAIYAGQLVKFYEGDFGRMGATLTLVYIIGLVIIWLAPETKGKPLPE